MQNQAHLQLLDPARRLQSQHSQPLSVHQPLKPGTVYFTINGSSGFSTILCYFPFSVCSQPSMFQQMAATAGGVAVGSAVVSFSSWFEVLNWFHPEYVWKILIVWFRLFHSGSHRWTRTHGNVLRRKWFQRGGPSSSSPSTSARLSGSTTARWQQSMRIWSETIFTMCWKSNRYLSMPRIQWSGAPVQNPIQCTINTVYFHLPSKLIGNTLQSN